jgi:hypothetical protein
MILCGILILFFAWLLIHAFIYSKSNSQYRLIEGLDPSASPTAAPTSAPTSTAPTTAPTTTTTAPETPSQMQTQIDENTAQIAILKTQIASLITTATQLNAATLQNEVGIVNNINGIQKVVKSQADMQTKLANMKSAQ